jgi:hypothetical protein
MKIYRSFIITLSFSLLIITSATEAFQQTIELKSKGITYNRAQITKWLDNKHFIVVRSDGTNSIFRQPVLQNELGPVLTQVFQTPSGKAVEMVTPISENAFVTSNDENSLAVWSEKNSKYCLMHTADYAAKYGTANSGAVVKYNNKSFFISGHAEGYIIIWKLDGSRLLFNKAVSVRSEHPIPSPYRLWNVRSVVLWKDGMIVTGAEDGDICLISYPDGLIKARLRYNQKAQRGINQLSLYNNYLFLANCSVGSEDKNFWLYKLQDNRIIPIDSVNLIEDKKLAQVFDFNIQIVPNKDKLLFVASTQEGLLWVGKVDNGKIKIISNTKVSSYGAAAISYQTELSTLSVVAHDIRLYDFIGILH